MTGQLPCCIHMAGYFSASPLSLLTLLLLINCSYKLLTGFHLHPRLATVWMNGKCLLALCRFSVVSLPRSCGSHFWCCNRVVSFLVTRYNLSSTFSITSWFRTIATVLDSCVRSGWATGMWRQVCSTSLTSLKPLKKWMNNKFMTRSLYPLFSRLHHSLHEGVKSNKFARENSSPGHLPVPPPYHSAETPTFHRLPSSRTADKVTQSPGSPSQLSSTPYNYPAASHFDSLLLFGCLGEDWWRRTQSQ